MSGSYLVLCQSDIHTVYTPNIYTHARHMQHTQLLIALMNSNTLEFALESRGKSLSESGISLTISGKYEKLFKENLRKSLLFHQKFQRKSQR